MVVVVVAAAAAAGYRYRYLVLILVLTSVTLVIVAVAVVNLERLSEAVFTCFLLRSIERGSHTNCIERWCDHGTHVRTGVAGGGYLEREGEGG